MKARARAREGPVLTPICRRPLGSGARLDGKPWAAAGRQRRNRPISARIRRSQRPQTQPAGLSPV